MIKGYIRHQKHMGLTYAHNDTKETDQSHCVLNYS
jgi:hypothetical protein